MRSPASGSARTPLSDEPLVGEAQLGELGSGTGGFAECATLGAGDEDQRRRRGIGEHGDRGLVDRALAFQPFERADAGRLLRCRREVARPRRRQRQQSQRVTSGCRVEDDMVVATGRGRVSEEPRERVERGDLDRAGAGELFLERGQLAGWERGAVGADDSLTVGVGRGLRVEVHQVERRDTRRGRGSIAGCGLEDVGEVGGRVGADEQHPPTRVGERDAHSARDSGLADAALAGEEHEPACASRSSRAA